VTYCDTYPCHPTRDTPADWDDEYDYDPEGDEQGVNDSKGEK
jgi:hypothetical protein